MILLTDIASRFLDSGWQQLHTMLVGWTKPDKNSPT